MSGNSELPNQQGPLTQDQWSRFQSRFDEYTDTLKSNLQSVKSGDQSMPFAIRWGGIEATLEMLGWLMDDIKAAAVMDE